MVDLLNYRWADVLSQNRETPTLEVWYRDLAKLRTLLQAVFGGFLVGAKRLEDFDGYLATLTILVDRQQIPRQVLDSIGLDQNVSKRPTADQVRNTLDCENIDPLTRCLQLFHKLVQARNSKFLKGLVTRNI